MPTAKQPIQLDEVPALANAVEVVGADGKVATEFLVLPFGDPIRTRDDRTFIMRDAAHAERVLAATANTLGGVEMMIDYDHQAAYAGEGKGNQAPAAGWVKKLSVGEKGIVAQVEWTAPARAALEAREYRYISPDFRFARQTGEVTRIVRAGLTNSPALDLPALAHVEAGHPAGEDMTTITLAVAGLATSLGLTAAGLDEAKVLAAIDELKAGKAGSDQALASIRTELALADDADEVTVLASIKDAKKPAVVDPTQFVPKAGYDELSARLAKIEGDALLAQVDAAVAEGKIAPAMKQWAIDLGKKDAAALASFIQNSVPFAGTAQIKGDPAPKKGELSDEERATCAMTGVSEADFLKVRDGVTEEAA